MDTRGTSERHVITNGHVVTPFERIPQGCLCVEDGKIVCLGSQERTAECCAWRDTSDAIDAGGGFVIPGLIDTHVCGMLGYDCRQGRQAFSVIGAGLVAHGVTGFLPTIYLTPSEQALPLLAEVQALRDSGYDGAEILGVHLEGPYLGEKYRGLALAELLGTPDLECDRQLYARFPSLVKLVTLAPELPGCLPYIRFLKDNGVKVAIGHSEIDTKEQLNQAVAAGVSHVTHIYNAMAVRHLREAGVDAPGLADLALVEDRLSVSVIVDGVHVCPELVDLLVRAKSIDKIVLITDCFQGTGLPPGRYTYPDGVEVEVDRSCHRTIPDKLLAGSVLTLNRAVSNTLAFTSLTVGQAVQMGTYNPARLLGLDGRKGQLRIGFDADLVVTNEEWEVQMTLVGGRVAFRAKA